MKKRLYSFIYYRLLGWKTNVTVPNYDKCVICAAPHTSNWDLFIGKLFYGAIGRKTSFMMKKEWFFSFRIDIQSHRRHTGRPKPEHIFGRPDGKQICRKQTVSFSHYSGRYAQIQPKLEKGFYFIALKAQVPIMLIGIDYPTKTITSTKAIMPTGDFEKDMHEIKLYFKDFRGKIPENFSVGIN